MLGKIVFMLAFGLAAAGTLRAGEESVMPMRGESPDGQRQINQFQFDRGAQWLGAVSLDAPAPTEAAGGDMEYLGWKDSCVWTPRSVAGQVLKMEGSSGFGLTPRYVETPGMDASGFLETLAKELSLESLADK